MPAACAQQASINTAVPPNSGADPTVDGDDDEAPFIGMDLFDGTGLYN